MKKTISLLLTSVLLMGALAGCGAGKKKIAIIRNLIEDDHTTQFIAGAAEQGETEGYQVDSFISGGDDEKTKSLMEDAIKKGYDGIILSHGKEDYAYDLVKKATDKGIKVVTFDTVFKEPIEGVTQTTQNDKQLAELSLGALINGFEAPVKIVKIWYSGGMLPFDNRNAVYQQMEKEGKIKTVGEIDLKNLSNVQGDVETELSKLLASGVKIDGVWGSWDEMAKGALAALNKAKKTDIRLVSIDISDKDRELMQENSKVWTATAAVDAYMIGTANMKLIIKKLNGEKTEATELFEGDLYNLAPK